MQASRTRSSTPAAILAALSLAGCAQGLTANAQPQAPVNPTTFEVALSPPHPPAQGPAPSGSVTFRALASRGELCWTFTRLAGVPDPSGAFINVGVVGASQLGFFYRLGATFAPSGCIKMPASGLGYLTSSSGAFFVEVDAPHQPAVLSGRL